MRIGDQINISNNPLTILKHCVSNTVIEIQWDRIYTLALKSNLSWSLSCTARKHVVKQTVTSFD